MWLNGINSMRSLERSPIVKDSSVCKHQQHDQAGIQNENSSHYFFSCAGAGAVTGLLKIAAMVKVARTNFFNSPFFGAASIPSMGATCAFRMVRNFGAFRSSVRKDANAFGEHWNITVIVVSL